MVTALGNPKLSDYAEIARRPLEAEQSALVVIDIQEKLLPPIFQIRGICYNDTQHGHIRPSRLV